MKICFATNNANKLKELRAKVPESVQIYGLKDIGCTEELPETGDTLKHNAHEKAQFVYDRYGVDCFADDTGLEVLALNGAPGVYSARYAGPECKAQDNIKKLLSEMSGKSERSARFRTMICLIQDGKAEYFEGMVEGTITEEITGESGFGYDPIFKPLGFDSTFALMSMEQKNDISHRGKAVDKLLLHITNLLKEKGQ